LENKQELPAGWKWVKLGEVCEYSSGIWGDEPDNSENCYFVLRSNNIKDGKMIFTDLALRKVDAKYVESKSLKNGDILVTTSSGSKDLLGKSAIFIPPDDRTYLFSNFTMRLRANPLLADSFYVFLYLQSPEAKKILQLLQDTTTGLRNLDRREFMNQLIPLPPLSEQKRIAEKLKAMMDEIDEAKASIEKQLEAAKTLPSAYLREVFESPEAQKWEKKKLGEVIKLTQSGIWGEDPFRAPKEEIFTVIRSTEIDHKGTISIKDERVAQRRVKPETARKYFLKPNDLLIVRSGGTTGKIILGRVGLYLGEPDKYLFSNFLLKMRVDENLILPEFLWRYLNWDKFLEDNIPNLMRRTTGIQNLPMDEYFSILIPLPPLSEQKRIAAYLKEKIDQAEKLRETLEKELETLNTLPQSILSKAFRGEI